ncbi:hypothetical protein BHM03_00062871 [Ensete ventricosum]|nr:hypothetical protein BHM03_00062871 [Ensete ventricosum]
MVVVIALAQATTRCTTVGRLYPQSSGSPYGWVVLPHAATLSAGPPKGPMPVGGCGWVSRCRQPNRPCKRLPL